MHTVDNESIRVCKRVDLFLGERKIEEARVVPSKCVGQWHNVHSFAKDFNVLRQFVEGRSLIAYMQHDTTSNNYIGRILVGDFERKTIGLIEKWNKHESY